jgi:hypothetical protein
VKLATGDEKNPPLGQLGTVSATAEDCDRLIADSLRELLAESRALGGTGVQQVQFRRRWLRTDIPTESPGTEVDRPIEPRGVAVK